MIELELFYKIVESAIRGKHVKYLKRQKCLPSDQMEIQSDETIETSNKAVSAADGSDEFVYSDKPKLREKAKRVKAFNKGIETALKVLICEFKHFNNRLKKDENRGGI